MTVERTCWAPEGLAGERVDAGLARLLGISRSHAARLASQGLVEVNGTVAGKSQRLAGGELLRAKLPDPDLGRDEPSDDDESLRIVLRDPHLVIVDKPAGMAAHPSPGWWGPTVTGALGRRGISLATEGPPERYGIVHRLDAGTSGLMALACSNQAYRRLKKAFKHREVTKTYHALTQGILDPVTGTITAPIGRHPGATFRFAVTHGGKSAVTHYEVIEIFRGACLAKIGLETGRTHQIRVHLSAMGHPLVGDTMYGANPREAGELKLTRQWLHATGLSFAHPVSEDLVDVTCEYPPELQRVLAVLRGQAA